MRTHTEYIGIKVEPKLKKDCAKLAKASKLGLSAWIRYLMIVAAQSNFKATK